VSGKVYLCTAIQRCPAHPEWLTLVGLRGGDVSIQESAIESIMPDRGAWS